MNLFKDLKHKEVHCVASSCRESAKYIAQNKRLGVCVFEATGLASFCYATGKYTCDISKENSPELIEVRHECDESIKVFTDHFYPLNYFDCPKVIFRYGGEELKFGRVLGFDYENQECLIYEEMGDSTETYNIPVSDVCLETNIDGWGE